MQSAYQYNAVVLLQTVDKPSDDVLFHDARERKRTDLQDPKVHDRNEPNRHQHGLRYLEGMQKLKKENSADYDTILMDSLMVKKKIEVLRTIKIYNYLFQF